MTKCVCPPSREMYECDCTRPDPWPGVPEFRGTTIMHIFIGGDTGLTIAPGTLPPGEYRLVKV